MQPGLEKKGKMRKKNAHFFWKKICSRMCEVRKKERENHENAKNSKECEKCGRNAEKKVQVCTFLKI